MDQRSETTLGRWGLRLQTLAWFLLLLALALSLPVLMMPAPWVPVVVAAAALVLGLPFALWRHRRGRSLPWVWFKGFLIAFSILGLLLAAPVYYLALSTALRPALQPQVLLSNGSKTLTFQGMIHIGSDRFYRSIVFDLERALTEDQVLFYEGVSSDPAGDAWLGQHVGGGEDLDKSYGDLAKACGLQFQSDYLRLLAPDMQARPEHHVTADVSTLDMKREYERLIATDPAFATAMAKRERERNEGPKGSSFVTTFLQWQKGGSAGQKSLAGILCRGLLSQGPHEDDKDPLNRVVLDFRNAKVVERILAEPNAKIYMTYGAAHLPGIYALLRKTDPNWKVLSVKWLRSVEPPDEAQGHLDLRD